MTSSTTAQRKAAAHDPFLLASLRPPSALATATICSRRPLLPLPGSPPLRRAARPAVWAAKPRPRRRRVKPRSTTSSTERGEEEDPDNRPSRGLCELEGGLERDREFRFVRGLAAPSSETGLASRAPWARGGSRTGRRVPFRSRASGTLERDETRLVPREWDGPSVGRRPPGCARPRIGLELA